MVLKKLQLCMEMIGEWSVSGVWLLVSEYNIFNHSIVFAPLGLV